MYYFTVSPSIDKEINVLDFLEKYHRSVRSNHPFNSTIFLETEWLLMILMYS